MFGFGTFLGIRRIVLYTIGVFYYFVLIFAVVVDLVLRGNSKILQFAILPGVTKKYNKERAEIGNFWF